jgi:multisubunit Na+/H+ antiporter MnhF subunit
MIDAAVTFALVALSLAAACFLWRLFRGPTIADRVLALDGLLMVVTCGIMVDATQVDSVSILDTNLIVALVAFVGTGILARYVAERGNL